MRRDGLIQIAKHGHARLREKQADALILQRGIVLRLIDDDIADARGLLRSTQRALQKQERDLIFIVQLPRAEGVPRVAGDGFACVYICAGQPIGKFI